jgi:hypothetical protein
MSEAILSSSYMASLRQYLAALAEDEKAGNKELVAYDRECIAGARDRLASWISQQRERRVLYVDLHEKSLVRGDAEWTANLASMLREINQEIAVADTVDWRELARY